MTVALTDIVADFCSSRWEQRISHPNIVRLTAMRDYMKDEIIVCAHFQNGDYETMRLGSEITFGSKEDFMAAISRLTGKVEWPGDTDCGWPSH